MRLKNHTDIPNERIREMIRFTCPPGVAGFDVRVNNMTWKRGWFRGSAYAKGSGYHSRACPFIVVSIGFDDLWPNSGHTASKRGGYLPTPWMASREEALVYVIAHELRHLWQGRVPRGRRVWGARGQYSERDADAYAIRMLRAWRRRPTTTEETPDA
jgi:hypothetical protein